MKTTLHTYYQRAQVQVGALQESIRRGLRGPDADRVLAELLEHHTITVELENALREEQQTMEQVTRGRKTIGTSIFVAVISTTGRIMYAGAGFDPILGLRPYDAINRSIYGFMDPSDADELASALRLMEATSEAVRIRIRLGHSEGSTSTIAGSARVIAKGPSGSAVLIRAAIADFEPPEDGQTRFFRRYVVRNRSDAAIGPAGVDA